MFCVLVQGLPYPSEFGRRGGLLEILLLLCRDGREWLQYITDEAFSAKLEHLTWKKHNKNSCRMCFVKIGKEKLCVKQKEEIYVQIAVFTS